MECRITLKESFLKRRISGETEIPAEIKLSNGKEYRLYFILEKSIIEVTHKRNEVNNTELTAEERIVIIEAILSNFCCFGKSLINLSVAYYFEHFKLADTTTVKDEDYNESEYASKISILEEYMKSDTAKASLNVVFRDLYEIYLYLIKNRNEIEADGAVINYSYELNPFQRMDLRYFASALVSTLKIGEFVFELVKGENQIKLIPKQ